MPLGTQHMAGQPTAKNAQTSAAAPGTVAGEACCAADESSGCPPPLMWKDVLSRVEAGLSEQRMSRNGANVTVRMFGAGTPLVVRLGLLGDWRLFALTAWLLRDEFQTVIVDPPSSGKRLPKNRYSAVESAADLLAAADAVHIRRFRLFATSFGSPSAFQAMITATERIESAVIHAPVVRVRFSLAERLLTSLGRLSSRAMRDVPFFGRIQERNHRPWFPPFDSSRWRFLQETLGATYVRDFARQVAALKSFDVRRRLGTIATPILLLHSEGGGDSGVRAVNDVKALLPNARSGALPHSGYFPFLTHPHLLAKHVRSLSAVQSQSSAAIGNVGHSPPEEVCSGCE